MSETATGIARVTVLSIVTVAFSLIWASDQQAQEQFVIARKAAAHEHQLAKRTASYGSEAAISCVASGIRRDRPQNETCPNGSRKHVSLVELEMELPAGIGPGRYRVVDQSGTIQTIRLRRTSRPVTLSDIYSLEMPGGSQRYFIRLIAEERPVASGRDRLRR